MIHISQNDEEYKKYAGFHYEESIIERLAEMELENSRIFIDYFSHPRPVLLGAIESLAYSKTKRLELKFQDARNTLITSRRHKFKGHPVNWSTWRQFNSIEKSDKDRKEVFDEFITKTKYLSPIVEKRFSKIKQIYNEYNDRHSNKGGKNVIIDPVGAYLEHENISYDKLVKIVKSMGENAKKSFREALSDIGKTVLGREPEYYDDFYYFRNKVYSDVSSSFTLADPVAEVKRILNNMEFDLSKIHFDTEDRKNKYPSPICFSIRIPSDIRILYKRESPYFDFQSCFHETGHAMHFSTVSVYNDYWDKYIIPMGIAEVFSMFLESLTKNRNYLRSLIDSGKEHITNKIISRNRFMDLFFVTFYAANSLMKLRYWRENLSIDQACNLYSKLIKEYTGFEIPGEYWLLHHILPESIMYVPSYLLAAVRAAELNTFITNKFGDKWWRDKDTGRTLREIMEPGANIDLSLFSNQDSSSFMREITKLV